MNLLGLRISPDYLNQLRKDVFLMIRQLGPPTFLLHLLVLKVNGFLY